MRDGNTKQEKDEEEVGEINLMERKEKDEEKCKGGKVGTKTNEYIA